MQPLGLRPISLPLIALAATGAPAKPASAPVSAITAPSRDAASTTALGKLGTQANRAGHEDRGTNAALAGASAALDVGVPATEISDRLAQKLPALVATYKDIHQNPELSTTESRTSAIVSKRLRELGFEVTENFGRYADPKLASHGVVGVMKNGPGPTLFIREDMDALPITEETGLPYASKVKGVMHACGHDAHTTILLGTAALMAELKDRWSGTLILIGQPSEETLNGARALLDAGLYAKFGTPDFGLAMHVDGELPAGVVGTKTGYTHAYADTVNITMRGKTSHGARPWEGIDPVVMASAFVLEAQTLVSREIQTGKPAVVTVGAINGGKVANVIPDEVTLKMTLRSFEPEVRKKLLAGVARIANGIAAGRGVPTDRMPIIEHVESESLEANYNNPQLTSQLIDLWKHELGSVRITDQRLGGEDFALYTGADHKIPTVYSRVGATDPKVIEERERAGLPLPSTHQSTFTVQPEPTIGAGVTALVSAATSLLKRTAVRR